jgi:putative colanic acid biosynthesis acetyltransferase WcaF
MLDIESNRKTRKYQITELAQRFAWGVAQPLFRFSPRICFGWRNLLLRIFGAKIGRGVHVYSSATVYYPWNLVVGDFTAIGEDCLIYNLGKVTIGNRATISHRAHLCAGTHDYTDRSLPLIRSCITVGDDAWICADAFVGPDVRVGEGAIVGARAAVFKTVPDLEIFGGNPAKKIGTRVFQS